MSLFFRIFSCLILLCAHSVKVTLSGCDVTYNCIKISGATINSNIINGLYFSICDHTKSDSLLEWKKKTDEVLLVWNTAYKYYQILQLSLNITTGEIRDNILAQCTLFDGPSSSSSSSLVVGNKNSGYSAFQQCSWLVTLEEGAIEDRSLTIGICSSDDIDDILLRRLNQDNNNNNNKSTMWMMGGIIISSVILFLFACYLCYYKCKAKYNNNNDKLLFYNNDQNYINVKENEQFNRHYQEKQHNNNNNENDNNDGNIAL